MLAKQELKSESSNNSSVILQSATVYTAQDEIWRGISRLYQLWHLVGKEWVQKPPNVKM